MERQNGKCQSECVDENSYGVDKWEDIEMMHFCISARTDRHWHF